MKLTSDDLLDRLKKKGTRDQAYTKALIIEKLNDNDADVATTSLKVTVSCPLGKSRMRVRQKKSIFKNRRGPIKEIYQLHFNFYFYFIRRFLVVLKLALICNVLTPRHFFK
jgi:hypothetical protein